MEYSKEEVVNSVLQTHLNEKSVQGWSLTWIELHPHRTEEAEPIWIIIWERAL